MLIRGELLFTVYGYTPVNRLIILQILTRDSKGISEEQMKEFRTSFNFFDKVCSTCLYSQRSRGLKVVVAGLPRSLSLKLLQFRLVFIWPAHRPVFS